jgi:hypothetical protein
MKAFEMSTKFKSETWLERTLSFDELDYIKYRKLWGYMSTKIVWKPPIHKALTESEIRDWQHFFSSCLCCSQYCFLTLSLSCYLKDYFTIFYTILSLKQFEDLE